MATFSKQSCLIYGTQLWFLCDFCLSTSTLRPRACVQFLRLGSGGNWDFLSSKWVMNRTEEEETLWWVFLESHNQIKGRKKNSVSEMKLDGGSEGVTHFGKK